MKTALKKNEQVILVTHPHWLTLSIPAVITLAAAIVGFVISFNTGMIVLILFGFYFLYKLFERNRNIWAVTDLRVIDEFGVFSSNAKESPLEKINNVSYHQSLIGRIFGFGNVEIQTAAEAGATVYTMVQDPGKLKDAITRMKEEYKDRIITRQAGELANAFVASQKGSKDVASEIEKLFDLKQKGIISEEEYLAAKQKILNS